MTMMTLPSSSDKLLLIICKRQGVHLDYFIINISIPKLCPPIDLFNLSTICLEIRGHVVNIKHSAP